jgi:hypothetical protein
MKKLNTDIETLDAIYARVNWFPAFCTTAVEVAFSTRLEWLSRSLAKSLASGDLAGSRMRVGRLLPRTPLAPDSDPDGCAPMRSAPPRKPAGGSSASFLTVTRSKSMNTLKSTTVIRLGLCQSVSAMRQQRAAGSTEADPLVRYREPFSREFMTLRHSEWLARGVEPERFLQRGVGCAPALAH